jgi:hypothetical protein
MYYEFFFVFLAKVTYILCENQRTVFFGGKYEFLAVMRVKKVKWGEKLFFSWFFLAS